MNGVYSMKYRMKHNPVRLSGSSLASSYDFVPRASASLEGFSIRTLFETFAKLRITESVWKCVTPNGFLFSAFYETKGLFFLK